MRCRVWVCAATLFACEAVGDGDDNVVGKSIGPAGGFVTSEDGVFTVIFPPGALPETMAITVRDASDVPMSLGTAYAVGGAASVALPIFVEYRYLLEQVAGQDLGKLNIGAAATDRWVPLVRIEHSTATQTVSAQDETVSIAYGLIIGGVDDQETGSTGGETQSTESEDTEPTETQTPPETESDPTLTSGPTSSATETGNDTDPMAGCGNGEAEAGELCLELVNPLVGGGLGLVALSGADVDDDGAADLVVAHNGTSDVSVRLGDGMGDFGGETLVALPSAPTALAVADFDGANGPDIATASAATVDLLLSAGGGAFDPAVTLAVANGSIAVGVGDLDEDDLTDLVVAHTSGGQLGLLRGDAAGLVDEILFPSSTGPVGLVVAEVNGDANLDVVVGDAAGISLHAGNGQGLLGAAFPTALAATVAAVAAADFNGDTFVDLAVVDSVAAQVLIHFGNGVGGFAGGTPYAVGLDPVHVVAQDLDGDGNADVAVSGSGDDTVTVLLGRNNGSFELGASYVVGSTPGALAVADFNGDTQLDLAFTQTGDDSVGLLISAP